jgi:site-specific DNA recombinase
MKRYFAYVRVSTAKQKIGVSLEEQRRSISEFAQSNDCYIIRWFEEAETAAHGGRRIFTGMLSLLEKGEASGLILHKIDRGARNLKDWALIGDLIDDGIDVRFAHENLDMESRGGRLAADIQAVIAADYIRNLREEVRKGMEGRLRQGLYPFQAPLGYLDRGSGKPKALDPTRAPLVIEAFHFYATGEYSIQALREVLFARGLVNRRGHQLSPTAMSRLLHNPFYTGRIRIGGAGEEVQGAHRPIVSPALFEKVQSTLRERRARHVCYQKHSFAFSRHILCACGWHLTGERQKGHVYYRCHRCLGTSVREELIRAALESSDGSHMR